VEPHKEEAKARYGLQRHIIIIRRRIPYVVNVTARNIDVITSELENVSPK
jgi:hypothetical protein